MHCAHIRTYIFKSEVRGMNETGDKKTLQGIGTLILKVQQQQSLPESIHSLDDCSLCVRTYREYSQTSVTYTHPFWMKLQIK